MISFKCTCGADTRVADRFAGKLGRCPKCGNTVRIPGGRSKPAPANWTDPLATDPAAKADADPSTRAERGGASDDRSEALDALSSAGGGVPARHVEPRRIAPPPLPRARRGDPRVLTVVAGGLMLLTIFLPWMIRRVPTFEGLGIGAHKTDVTWSWDIIGQPGVPASLVVFMIGCWTIGLAVGVLAFCLSGLPLSASKTGLALVGLILLLVLLGDLTDLPGPGQTLLGPGRTALAILGAILLPVLVIATHLRLRLGPSTPLRVAQGVPAGLLAIFAVIQLFMTISDYSGLPPFARGSVVFDIVFLSVLGLAALAAYIVALVHAANVRLSGRMPSVVSMSILYSVLSLVCLYLIVRPALAAEQAGLALLMANILLLLVPVAFLFCSGAINLGCDMRRSYGISMSPAVAGAPVVARPATPVASARQEAVPATQGDVAKRLQQLEQLKQQGLVSEEEFAVKRAKILEAI